MAKQNPYRFSLGFDEEDPDHQEVARILNQLGHRKAKFVVKAVLAYHQNIEGKFSKEQAVIDKKLDIQLQDEFLPTLQEEDILMIQKNKELLQEMEKEELEENKSSYKEEL